MHIMLFTIIFFIIGIMFCVIFRPLYDNDKRADSWIIFFWPACIIVWLFGVFPSKIVDALEKVFKKSKGDKV